jgi:hypothetical protein
VPSINGSPNAPTSVGASHIGRGFAYSTARESLQCQCQRGIASPASGGAYEGRVTSTRSAYADNWLASIAQARSKSPCHGGGK